MTIETEYRAIDSGVAMGHETETLTTFLEIRPRRDVGTSRDRLDTETSRPRPQPCWTGAEKEDVTWKTRTNGKPTAGELTALPQTL